MSAKLNDDADDTAGRFEQIRYDEKIGKLKLNLN